MEIIKLSPYDLVGIDNRGLIIVNGNRNISSYYNPSFFTFKCANPTQEAIIKKANPHLTLKSELQQLKNINLLVKKLKHYFNQLERIKSLSGDDLIIKKRQIIKSKAILKVYLAQLHQDEGFTLEKEEHQLRLVYKGSYVNAVKVIQLD